MLINHMLMDPNKELDIDSEVELEVELGIELTKDDVTCCFYSYKTQHDS